SGSLSMEYSAVTGFAQKVLVSDPLPPPAALPLCKGENALVDLAGFIVPLGKGDGREAAGGRSHIKRKYDSLCKAAVTIRRTFFRALALLFFATVLGFLGVKATDH